MIWGKRCYCNIPASQLTDHCQEMGSHDARQFLLSLRSTTWIILPYVIVFSSIACVVNRLSQRLRLDCGFLFHCLVFNWALPAHLRLHQNLSHLLIDRHRHCKCDQEQKPACPALCALVAT
jgi:hypothetical protein